MSFFKGLFIAVPLCLAVEASAYCAFVKATVAEPIPARVWVVITTDGNLYNVGSGDTCTEAWVNHYPIPDNYYAIYCQ